MVSTRPSAWGGYTRKDYRNRSNERERHGLRQTAGLEFPTESRLCVCGGEATKYDRQIFDSIIQDNTMKRVQPFVYFCLNCTALQNKWMSRKQCSGFWYSRTLMLVCCPLTSQRAVYSARHNTSNTFNGYRWFAGSFTSNVFTSNRTGGMSEAFLAHSLDERQVTYSSSQPVHRTCRDRKKSRLQPRGRFTQRKTLVVWTKKEQKKKISLYSQNSLLRNHWTVVIIMSKHTKIKKDYWPASWAAHCKNRDGCGLKPCVLLFTQCFHTRCCVNKVHDCCGCDLTWKPICSSLRRYYRADCQRGPRAARSHDLRSLEGLPRASVRNIWLSPTKGALFRLLVCLFA